MQLILLKKLFNIPARTKEKMTQQIAKLKNIYINYVALKYIDHGLTSTSKYF